MPGVLDLQNGRIERTRPRAVPEAERPGWLETIGASFRVSRADTTGYNEQAQQEAYNPLINALGELGYEFTSFVNPRTGVVSPEAVWRVIDKERANGRFGGLPRTAEEFEQQWRDGLRQKLERDEQRAAQGNIAARFIGGVGGAATDPVALYTLPLGGFGSTVARRVGSEVLVQAAIEGVLTPTINQNRRELGRPELTGEEMALNIGLAGVAGGALRGGVELAPGAWRGMKAAPRAVQERAWAAILDRTPGLRDKVGSTIEWDALDAHLPDIVEALVPEDARPPELRGALAVARGEARFAQANPFADDAAGRAAHRDGMAVAMQRIMADMEGRAPAPVPAATRARLAQDTAITTRVVPGDARSVVKSRIGIVESGGSATARNPRSSATGTFQFIESTWLRTYKNRYGQNGLTDAQILAKRTDPRLQNILMDDLMDANIRALQADGIAPTAGNIYLAHFSGSAGARALHRTPNAPVEAILGADVVRANPFLRGMTGRDVIAWAERKMGGSTATVGARAGEAAPSRTDELQQSIDALQAERAALARAAGEDPADPLDAALDDALPEPLPESGLDIPEVRREDFAPEETLPEAVADLLPGLRGIAADRTRSLNQIDRLAEELGADPADVRAGLNLLAGEGRITINRRTGQFMRKPPMRNEDDVLMIVAKAGGLRDDEGHALGLRGLSAKEQRELHPAIKRNVLRKRAASGKRDWGKVFTQRGPLLRHEGRSVDQIGELLWEEGFFVERPTTAQVLDLLEQRIAGGKPIFAPGRGPDVDENGRTAAELAEEEAFLSNLEGPQTIDRERPVSERAEEFIRAWEQESGYDRSNPPPDTEFNPRDLPDWMLERIANDYWFERGEPIELLEAAIREEYDDLLRTADLELGEPTYAPDIDPAPGLAPDDIEQADAFLRWLYGDEAGPGDAGRAPDGGDAPEGGGAGRGAEEGEPETGPIEPEAHRAFDDPDGPGAAEQAESVLHDLRAGVFPAGKFELGIREGNEQFLHFTGADGRMDDIQLIFDPDGTSAEISISPFSASPNIYGPAVMRQFARQLAAMFPDLRTVRGERLTGAGPGRIQTMQLPRAPDTTEPAAGTVQRGQSVDEMLARISDLPDTVESEDALAAMRSALWEQETAAGTLDAPDNAISRFDEARDRWAAQFDEARAATLEQERAQAAQRNADLARAIVAAVEAGGRARMFNAVRKQINLYGAGTIREVDGRLQVIEGRKWVDVTEQEYARIASELGIAPPAARAPDTTEPVASTTSLRGDRIGDFYEFTGEEARIVAEALNIAVATRNGQPMAGIPVHAAANYMDELAAKGIRVELFGKDGTRDMASPASADASGQMDFAAPTQEQRRIALERQAEGRQKASVAQKPPGSDGGLFDIRAEDIAFRIDEEGDPVTARDLLADLDEDAEMLKNMKDCLK